MRILVIASKDLYQIVKDRKTALFLVIMPMLFTLFFGMVFGMDGEDLGGQSRLPVGVLNEDDPGSLGYEMWRLLEASEAIRPVSILHLGIIEAKEALRQGEYAAILVLPAGFTERLLRGDEITVQVIVDQGQPTGHVARQAIESAWQRLLGSVEMARFSLGAVQQQAELDEESYRSFLAEAISKGIDGWLDPMVMVESRLATAEAERSPAAFEQSSPGMIVQFAVFGLITSATILVLERKSGALKRMLTAPIRRAETITGHIMAMFVVVFIQQTILIGVGQFVLGVDYLREPLAVLVMVLSLSLWIACLGLFISTVSGGEDQVIAISMVAMFVFSALGGAWFPLDVAGATFAAIGKTMPSAWAMMGFQHIIVRGLGVSAVLLPAAILLGYAALFFVLALWRFRLE